MRHQSIRDCVGAPAASEIESPHSTSLPPTFAGASARAERFPGAAVRIADRYGCQISQRNPRCRWSNSTLLTNHGETLTTATVGLTSLPCRSTSVFPARKQLRRSSIDDPVTIRKAIGNYGNVNRNVAFVRRHAYYK